MQFQKGVDLIVIHFIYSWEKQPIPFVSDNGLGAKVDKPSVQLIFNLQ